MDFDIEVARNSIYLDFEGEGKSNNKGIPLPHMAGVFRPKADKGGGGSYEPVFFRDNWIGPRNGSKDATILGFENFIDGLIREVKEKQGLIVFWSDYERSVIELNLPHRLQAFNEHSFNLLPPFRKLKNREKKELDKTIPKVLNQYMKAFHPNRKLVPDLEPGAAEICRRIDNFCEKYKKWRQWPEEKKQYVYDLLEYNKLDCVSTWLLAKKLGNRNNTLSIPM